jgi:23S rRNA A2030 N6-methylase RlmJ
MDQNFDDYPGMPILLQQSVQTTMQVRVLDFLPIEYQLLSINRHIRLYYCTTETMFRYQEPKQRLILVSVRKLFLTDPFFFIF